MDADQLRAHLAACSDCRAFKRRTAELDAALASAIVVEPPAELALHLAALAHQAAHPAPARTRGPQPARRNPWQFGLELAMAAIVTVLFSMWWQDLPTFLARVDAALNTLRVIPQVAQSIDAYDLLAQYGPAICLIAIVWAFAGPPSAAPHR
jgi:predicted anti-sigma-YlaC factor YlaD